MINQLQLRNDIEYLATHFVQPTITVVNGDINKSMSFNDLPVLLSFIRPEEIETLDNGNRRTTFRVINLLLYSKLPQEPTEEELSDRYDEQFNEMADVLDNIYQGLTASQIMLGGTRVRNPFVKLRDYASEDSVKFTRNVFEFGSNRFMALEATTAISMPRKTCFNCADFKTETFTENNLP